MSTVASVIALIERKRALGGGGGAMAAAASGGASAAGHGAGTSVGNDEVRSLLLATSWLQQAQYKDGPELEARYKRVADLRPVRWPCGGRAVAVRWPCGGRMGGPLVSVPCPCRVRV